jgi:hypothetical protein
MKKEVTLQRVDAYIVKASTDERGSSVIVGYYSERNVADLSAKGAGWWGQDGEVISKQMLQDSNGNLYSADTVGKFTDLDQRAKQQMLDSIKSKLSPAEWEFYQKHSKSRS